ncbi:unnamed protein product, partial [Prorocentrum cordatum]
MAVSKETLIYSYVFTFAVLLAVMTNTCQYFARHPPRKDTWWGCNGPLVLLSLATLFLLVAPLKNLVVNVCMQSFRQNGYDNTIEAALDFAYWPCFKHVQAYTVVAYVLMIWGTAMQVDIFSKFREGFPRGPLERRIPAAGPKTIPTAAAALAAEPPAGQAPGGILRGRDGDRFDHGQDETRGGREEKRRSSGASRADGRAGGERQKYVVAPSPLVVRDGEVSAVFIASKLRAGSFWFARPAKGRSSAAAAARALGTAIARRASGCVSWPLEVFAALRPEKSPTALRRQTLDWPPLRVAQHKAELMKVMERFGVDPTLPRDGQMTKQPSPAMIDAVAEPLNSTVYWLAAQPAVHGALVGLAATSGVRAISGAALGQDEVAPEVLLSLLLSLLFGFLSFLVFVPKARLALWSNWYPVACGPSRHPECV